MSVKGMSSLIDKMRTDDRLAEEFAIVVTDAAREVGYNFVEEEVINHFLNDAPVSHQFAFFIEGIKSGSLNATDLIKTIAGMAKYEGIDVSEPEIKKYVDEKPVARPMPRGPGRLTTMALGEEGRVMPPMTEAVGEEKWGSGTPSVTLAIGEEDAPRRPGITRAVGEESRGTGALTTMALGEEDGAVDPAPDATSMAVGEEDEAVDHTPDVTSMALGEEDGAPEDLAPEDQAPEDQDGGGYASTMAIGEEGGSPFDGMNMDEVRRMLDEAKKRRDKDAPPPDVTSMALGEEDDAPKPPVRTTMALGEEDKPRPDITTAAVGEEDKKPKRPKLG